MMPFAACCQTAGNFFFRTMAAPAESPIRAAPTRALEPGSQSQWALIRRRFLRHRVAVASLFLLSVLYVLAAGAEFFAPHSRQWRDLTHAYCPPQLPRFAFELLARISALEGQYHFAIEARVAGLGMLIRYEGVLHV